MPARDHNKGEGPAPGRLLAWYDANRRPFPWRRDNDPYRILVSEVMLQQTRTEVVKDRFPAFLERFPSLEALAAAQEDEVVAAWRGLGYYRRARSLHAAAQAITSAGSWPETAAALKVLPGIGDYTAAAVASIAFGEPVVVVDGNVRRLAARLSTEDGRLSRRAVVDRLGAVAGEWLDPARPGDSNQALMELGATICRPQPECDRCPLTAACGALAAGEPERWPTDAKKPTPILCHWRLALIHSGDRVWLVRRDRDERWLPGMYELPWVEADDEADEEPVNVEIKLLEKYGLSVRLSRRAGSVRHAIGRRSIRASVWSAQMATADEAAEPDASAAGRWVAAGEIERLATSSLVDKALATAG